MAKTKATTTPEAPVVEYGMFAYLPLKSISADPNQPRKLYSEKDMDELVDSIREKGVLQAILVRPLGNDKYMLVSGERRYRASLSVMAAFKNRNTIPALIKEMSDTEALEAQIIENLQRKDVHPMEEAVAFKSLRDKFSVEEIAVRVGKSPQYVAQRIKLTDLIQVFQDILFADKMKLKDAVKLARFGQPIQVEISKECRIPKDWQKRKDWELDDYLDSYLEDHEHDLSKAPFKTNDADLYPEAGPCNKCPHNSGCNKLLFPELEKKRICHNGVCYEIKSSRAYQKNIEAALQNPDWVFVCTDSYPGKEEKKKIKATEEAGAVVLGYDLFEVLETPDPVPTWEEYEAENDDWSDDETMSAKEKKEAAMGARMDWESDKEYHDNVLKEYNDAMSSGRAKKAFVVVGNYRAKEGSVIDIIIKPKKGAKLEIGQDATDAEKQLLQETEIAAIADRENRNKELDREKIYNRSMEALKEPFTSLTDPLHPEEWNALIVLLADNSYHTRDWAEDNIGASSNDYRRFDLFNALSKGIDEGKMFQMIRIAIYDKLVNKNEADYGKNGKAASMQTLAKLWIPDHVSIFETEQNEKADKRIKNVNKRLDALKKA